MGEQPDVGGGAPMGGEETETETETETEDDSAEENNTRQYTKGCNAL